LNERGKGRKGLGWEIGWMEGERERRVDLVKRRKGGRMMNKGVGGRLGRWEKGGGGE
jgi:hypothetical protein